MSNSSHSDITLVLDRSGSMQSIADDTVGGVARFLEDQKKAPGSANLTLTLFDHEYTPVHKAASVHSVPAFTREQFVPRGSTALLDAIGRSIVETGERLSATPEHDRPGSVIFVIVTDGLENASKEYSRARIAEMIKHQQDAYSWTFLFLAANQDAIATGADMGISAHAAMSFAPNPVGVANAYVASSNAVLRARVGGPAHYHQSDRDAQKKQGVR